MSTTDLTVQPLRVLVIAPAAESDLIAAQLALAGLPLTLERVDGERALDAALSACPRDVLLCDHELPGFDSVQALQILARHQVTAPLVIVSGDIGEETLAHALREGAADYVNKDHLDQLGPVLHRYLQDAALRARQSWLERTARDAEARMQSLMDYAPFPMSLRDLDGHFVIVNRLAASLMDHAPEDVLGHTAAELFDSDAAAAIDQQEGILRQTGKAISFELTGRTSDGILHDYLVSKYPVRDSDGKLVGVGGISLDITVRKQTENSLREAEDRFRGAFDAATIGMALVAPDGRWLQVNRALCNLVGYSEQELLGGDFQAITHPGDLDADLEYVRQVLAGEIETYQMDKRYIHKLGHTIWGRLSVSLVRDAQATPTHFVSQIQDITQQKDAQELAEQLRHSQKLDAVGRLAGGVAHDFNNMLTAIKGYSQLLLDALEPADPRRELAEQISRASEQASMLPRQLLAFSRKQVSQPKLVDVNDVLAAASDMLGRHFFSTDGVMV